MRVAATAALLTLTTTAALAGCGSPGSNAGAGGASAGADRSGLPANFFGIVAPEVLPAEASAQDQALDAQAKAGIGLIRQKFLWSEIEPKPGVFDFSLYDRLVGRAAHFGMTVMPIVFGISPGEGAKPKPGAEITDTTTMPPRSNAHFAAYAMRLVDRYGSNGTYWRDHPDIPKKPVTVWQVWNEPNLPPYWGGVPDPVAYAHLLRTTAAAIRKADPKATILTAGLPNSKLGGSLNTYVRRMVKGGAAGSFDDLAVHPYAQDATAVLASAKSAERVAVKAGAGKIGLWITEVGWAAGGPNSDFTVTEDQQAQLVGDLVIQSADQAKSLNLKGVVYYAWRDVPPYPGGQDFWGLHTGLVKLDNDVKPALSTFAASTKAARAGGS